jgi:hypothetical protein
MASNLLSPVLAILAVCSSPAAVMGADNPPATKAAAGDAASAKKPSIVVQNPDGTLTVQKVPPKDGAQNTRAKKGLVIPPQVVVPIVTTPQKQN